MSEEFDDDWTEDIDIDSEDANEETIVDATEEATLYGANEATY